MQASQLDQTPLVRNKQASHTTVDPIITGHSGGDVNDIGDTTTSKMSVKEYNDKVKIDKFAVKETPEFLEPDQDDADIDHVQRKSKKKKKRR